MSYGFLEKFHIHIWNVTVKRKNTVKDLGFGNLYLPLQR